MAYTNNTSTFGSGRLREAFDTPYAKAAQEWDRRMGLSIMQAHGWRRMAFVAWVIAGVLAIGLVIQSQNKQVATYVVPINELGQPGKITLASDAYQPTSMQTGYFLAELVRLSRSRSLDPVVTRDAMMKVYHFLAGDGITQMNALASGDALLADMGRGQRVARSVEIANVLQKSPTTYQVRWTEVEYASGMQRSREAYTGLFETKLVPPTRQDTAFNNPLGLYVTSFTWSKEFMPSVPPKPTGETSRAEQSVTPEQSAR
jgi:type IV secretion system protein TrbF